LVFAFLIALLTAIVLAVGIELSARWWIRRRRAYYVFPPGLQLRLHLDREALPELPPIARFEVNVDGERGREAPPVTRGHTLYRVLVAGGSQAEGYFLDQDATWPGALQRMLDTPEHRRRLGASAVHVGSVARSGVDADALARILDCVLPRYPRLDVILILVGASDMLRWLEMGASPAPPPPRSTSELFPWHPEGPFRWRPSKLAVRELLQRARRRWLIPKQEHSATGHWLTRARTMRAQAHVIKTAMPDAAPMLKHFERRLADAIERARSQADRVVLVRQPWFDKDVYTPEEMAHMWHGGAGEAWRQRVDTYYSIEVTRQLMVQIDQVAARVATSLSVEHIDLMPVLDRSLETYYDFFHLTPKGAAAVARTIAAALVRQSLPDNGELLSDVRVCGTSVDVRLYERRAV